MTVLPAPPTTAAEKGAGGGRGAAQAQTWLPGARWAGKALCALSGAWLVGRTENEAVGGSGCGSGGKRAWRGCPSVRPPSLGKAFWHNEARGEGEDGRGYAREERGWRVSGRLKPHVGFVRCWRCLQQLSLKGGRGGTGPGGAVPPRGETSENLSARVTLNALSLALVVLVWLLYKACRV